jgi:hypothetical protein
MSLLYERSGSAFVELQLKPSRIQLSRRLFSFPVVIGALLVVLTVLTTRERFSDPDLWWHLKVGAIIWESHTIPMSDLFSFTTKNHAWIPHEWLAEVLIYGAYKLGGYSGLMAWLCLVPSLLFIASYTLCSLYSGNAKVALIGALTTWLFATAGLAIRPHMIGYLLLTCELLIVHLGSSRDRRWFWLLPPLFAIWINCHGSFVFGLMLLALFLICSCIDIRVGLLVSKPWEHKQRNALAIASILSMAALFVNPVGYQQVLYPLDVMLNQSTNLAAVTEWQPLAFNEARSFLALVVAALVILIPLLCRSELRLQEVALVALGLGMAIRHTRMLFVFGILVAPVVCRLLAHLWDRYELAQDRIAPNLAMLFLSAGVVAIAFPSDAHLQRQVQEHNPVRAAEYLRMSGRPGNMLNEYQYGGYLIWAAPERKVFVDGRTDIFDWTGVLREYGAWATLQEDPKILLDKYDIEICLLAANAPMSRVLPYLAGWKLVYSDPQAKVFARSIVPNGN